MTGSVRMLSLSAVLLMLGALLVTASPAAAKDHPAKRPLQLSLGDSWAFGFGATVPSEGGYMPQLNDAIKDRGKCQPVVGSHKPRGGCRLLGLLNVAVGGATTPTMVADQFPQAIPLLEERNSNRRKRDDVRLTTLHIGGNDVTGPILSACAGGATPACFQVIQAELAAYEGDLDPAVATLREAAGGRAAIVIGTYDNGFANCNLGTVIPGAVQLAALVLEGGPGVSQGLHDIMREVASRYDVQVAEVFGDLAPEDWVGGTDCLHPDDSGYDKVTDAFLEVLGLA
jgi:lysophospholipase L1-like esterase